ncbi:hypothetical protein DsansV1_C26g0192641 [Dioscorea sansibarensis]
MEASSEMARYARSSMGVVHSQVRRVREEDLRIKDAIGEGFGSMDRDRHAPLHIGYHVDAIFSSRRCLPSSPLGHRMDGIDHQLH